MAEVGRLIEDNVAAFLLQLGEAGGGVTRDDGTVTWTVGGSPIGYHNAVVACRAPGAARASALVEEWRAELDARGLPGSWHLSPSMRPAALADLLAAAGFDDGGDEPAMAMPLDDLGDGRPAADGALDVRTVASAGDLDEYRRVLGDGFGEGPIEADWVASVFGRIGLDPAGGWCHLVGSVGDEPVATASVLVTDRVAGLYFVSTRPAFRRRGIGATVTHRALVEARELGATVAVLGSSPMGQRVYEALGFRTVFRYRLFEREPAGATP